MYKLLTNVTVKMQFLLKLLIVASLTCCNMMNKCAKKINLENMTGIRKYVKKLPVINFENDSVKVRVAKLAMAASCKNRHQLMSIVAKEVTQKMISGL